VIVEECHSCQLRTKYYSTSFSTDQRHMQMNYWGSSVWISKKHVNFRPYVLHSAIT